MMMNHLGYRDVHDLIVQNIENTFVERVSNNRFKGSSSIKRVG